MLYEHAIAKETIMPPKKPLVPPTMRGVSDLLSMDAEGEQATTTLPIDKIIVNPNQPRRYFDPDKMEQLVESVREHGILENLLVRSLPGTDSQYELVAGERRYRAAVAIGLLEVPVTVRDLTDEQALAIALVENLQREDLNPVEETEGILQLLSFRLQIPVSGVASLLYRMQHELKGQVTKNVLGSEQANLIVEVFEKLGRISWESFINSRIPLLKLPQEVLEALRQGKLEYTKARAIASVKDDKQRSEILEKAIAEDMSLSEIKRLIQEMRSPDTATPTVTLSDRYSDIGKRLKSAKVWDDTKKRKKLEKLLNDLEQLLD